jgi:spore germination cell wall hydrolase CwlJ-like protein
MLIRILVIFILLFTFQTAKCSTEFTRRDINCLTDTIYQEARGEGATGMWAVGNVVVNRLKSKWAKTICGVVYQKGQFSWTVSPVKVTDEKAHRLARLLAVQLLQQWQWEGTDNTGGATAFHYTGLPAAPKWTLKSKRLKRIGKHVFYRLPIRRSS